MQHSSYAAYMMRLEGTLTSLRYRCTPRNPIAIVRYRMPKAKRALPDHNSPPDPQLPWSSF
ncbi:hypothetical protein D9615_007092 [Tricholomella constricta]|uniref:Uncharacterized protein n=1 Tax=Tricholomella constricta TaxID=117010 RepID=A0A8H5H8G4_9AGAR|nr:hypothetical protein D9615_007092 [Tricholomella constricta]